MLRKIGCYGCLCRPICFFIVISIITLCGPCILTSFWVKEVKEIKEEVSTLSHKILKGILSEIDNVDTLSAPLYASSTNLVRFLRASIGETNISLTLIQEQVAPILFQALITIPHLSQISYIGFDGLLFSYYTKKNHHVVLYSNNSFSSSSNPILYTKSIDEDLGIPYGKGVLANTSWSQEAFTSMNKSTSIGHEWKNNEDILLFNTLRLNEKGVISMGFSIKFLEDYFSLVTLHNGSIYLDIHNGRPLIQGIPNTHLMFHDRSISFTLVNGKEDEIARIGPISCQPHGDKLNLWGRKYIISCSHLQIFGIDMEYVLAIPNEPLESSLKNECGLAYVLLILVIISMVIFILFFMISILNTTKREVCLCAALIKQLEATQQAERKSMNKSLAFARASHDVRTSLAGINGLIEISQEHIQEKSELGVNLMQMEACTKDLLGILNSILDTSKIEAGKLQLKEEDFDLQKLVEDVVDFHYNIAIKKGVDIILDLTDSSLPKYSCVKGDRGKLKQILDNLLSNAIKFTSEGHVIVRVWAKKPCFEDEILDSKWSSLINKCYYWRTDCLQQGENSGSCMPCSFFVANARESETMRAVCCKSQCIEFVFEVSDTGIGIPREKQKFVFENYVQVNEGKVGQEGTGLGLGIVQSLVRLIGGEISIMDKQRSERGACFKFNVFFEPKENGDNKILHNPKAEVSSHVIIFIQNHERGKVIKQFMEIRGIKVFVVKDYGDFCSHLQRIRGGKSHLHYHSSSGKFDLSVPMSQNSCLKTKDISLSAMDGRTNCAIRGMSSFNLFLIDTSSSALHEIHESLKEFRSEIGIMHSKVVWMKRLGTQSIEVEDLDDANDMIVSKPLHGSRLNQILNLLPEYGGSLMHYTMHGFDMSSRGNMKVDFSLGQCSKLDTHRPMSGKKILVAEDNLVQQMVTKQILSKLGFEVDVCETGAKAVELVSNGFRDEATQPYAYILMDCKMEKMDGFEASRHIREEEKKYGVHIPIIALTAHVVEDVIELINNAGMDHYLSKPLTREKILEAIKLLN